MAGEVPEGGKAPEKEDGKLFLHPLTLGEAMDFVEHHHRHHAAPQGGLFAIGCAREGDEEPCGVVIVGRPLARFLDDGWTAEVTRLCVLEGIKNGCSFLYAAAWRAARAMGYRKLVTYILSTEPGTSLKAAGWRKIGECGGGSWSRESRPRVDRNPTQLKIK